MESSAFRSHPRTSDPLAVIAVVAGTVGALCSGLLWLYQLQPGSSLMGAYAYELAHGGPLRTNLVTLALVLGGAAIVASLLGLLGTHRVRRVVVGGMLLGAIALSYPVCAMLNLVDAPLSFHLGS
jgi:hypothetical protein